ncbi:hypothetical protein P7K49_024568, partial [Saguinus oedipus]
TTLAGSSRLPGSMKTAENNRGTDSDGPRKRGLCVLCGLPAAGKSTFARALAHRLRQEQGWAVGVVAYDDVMPDAFLAGASALPAVSMEGRGRAGPLKPPLPTRQQMELG